MDAPVFVFGGFGQVGRAVVQAGSGRHVIGLGRDDVDLMDEAAIVEALDQHKPAAVLNAAVFQPVDRCETEVAEAFAINATAAGLLAAACATRGIRLIHLSTDYVFDGKQREPYTEGACPAPLSVYAASKLAGEHLVLAAHPGHCVVRTSSVYGKPLEAGGTLPFVARMLERARAGEATRVVADQVVSPTHADDLAMALWQLLDAEATGIVHAAGTTPASWHDLAEHVFGHAGRPDLLSRTTSAEFAAPAPRPAYSALGSNRLSEFGIDPLPGWQEGVERWLETV